MNEDNSQQPRVLSIIPARGGSKGIPRKNIRPLGGVPLLGYSCQCARNSRCATRTIVSTDCPEIADVARQFAVEVPFLRPKALASDSCPTMQVIQHALTWLNEHEAWIPEFVILLQPTSPLRTSADVDEALERLVISDADSVVSVCAVQSHFHPEWQFTMENGELQRYMTGPISGIPTRRQVLSPTFIRNGAIYAFRYQSFVRTGSIYGDRCLAFAMPSARSINIDTLDDWELAEAVLATRAKVAAA